MEMEIIPTTEIGIIVLIISNFAVNLFNSYISFRRDFNKRELDTLKSELNILNGRLQKEIEARESLQNKVFELREQNADLRGRLARFSDNQDYKERLATE
jgi:predicted  nucleic acid-binding Zn-ribbon protein